MIRCRQRKLRAIGLSLLGALLFGCASRPPIDPTLPMIAPGHVLVLPRPGDLGRTVEAAQLVTVHRDGKIFSFEGHVSITPDQFQLVGVDGMGRRALTVTWDKNGAIRAERAEWVPDAVAPGPMLADLVILYWPETVVRDALAGAGAELVTKAGNRAVLINGIETFQAEYAEGVGPAWTGKLRYENRAWGYEIEVQSVEVAP